LFGSDAFGVAVVFVDVAVVVVDIAVVVAVRRGGGGSVDGGGVLATLMMQPSCTATVSPHRHLLFGAISLS
jgi:hypothetical protein